jgi:hypothetical protein
MKIISANSCDVIQCSSRVFGEHSLAVLDAFRLSNHEAGQLIFRHGFARFRILTGGNTKKDTTLVCTLKNYFTNWGHYYNNGGRNFVMAVFKGGE